MAFYSFQPLLRFHGLFELFFLKVNEIKVWRRQTLTWLNTAAAVFGHDSLCAAETIE